MRRILIAIALLLPIPPQTALAHSGGLDEQGCHTNSQTGDYHCHGSGADSSETDSPSSPVAPPTTPASGSSGVTSRVCSNYEACMQYGKALLQLRQYGQAIAYFEVALQHQPGNKTAAESLNQARSSFAARPPARSRPQPADTPAIPSAPVCSSYAICMQLGANEILLKQYGLAVSFFEAALWHQPEDRAATASLERARLLLRPQPPFQ